ncbi:hypothetical protein ACRAWF_30620 [Streptomyces sp. L7]
MLLLSSAQRNLKHDLLKHMVLVAARQLLKQGKLDIAFGLQGKSPHKGFSPTPLTTGVLSAGTS